MRRRAALLTLSASRAASSSRWRSLTAELLTSRAFWAAWRSASASARRRSVSPSPHAQRDARSVLAARSVANLAAAAAAAVATAVAAALRHGLR
jgi:hypothetical protein